MKKPVIILPATQIIALLLILLLPACEHKDLCFEHPHYSSVRVTFAWDGIAGYDRPEGMRVVFYPEKGGDNWTFDFPGGDSRAIRLPEGDYRVACFNYDTEMIDWKNKDDHSTFMADTREVNSPDKTLARVTPDYLCGDNVEDFSLKASATGGEALLALHPRTMVCRYTYEVNGLRNLGQIADIRAGLSGMSGSLHMTSGRTSADTSESLLFGGAVSGEQVKGGCYTFGISGKAGEHRIFKLYVKNRSGGMQTLKEDVTDLVDEVSVIGSFMDVHIVIDLDYDISGIQPGSGEVGNDGGGGGNGNGAGFEVGADDWNDVNKDIFL